MLIFYNQSLKPINGVYGLFQTFFGVFGRQVSYHIRDLRDGVGTRSLGISTVTTDRRGSQDVAGGGAVGTEVRTKQLEKKSNKKSGNCHEIGKVFILLLLYI